MVYKMPIPLMLGFVKFLHDLFTAVWIGGLFILGVAILPSINRALGSQPEKKAVMDTIRKRFSIVVYISILGLLVTGIMLSNRSPLFLGYFNLSNEYSFLLAIKHLLIVLMVVLTVVRSVLLPRLTSLTPPRKMKLNGVVLFANIILGLLVLLLSGFTAAAALAPSPP